MRKGGWLEGGSGFSLGAGTRSRWNGPTKLCPHCSFLSHVPIPSGHACREVRRRLQSDFMWCSHQQEAARAGARGSRGGRPAGPGISPRPAGGTCRSPPPTRIPPALWACRDLVATVAVMASSELKISFTANSQQISLRAFPGDNTRARLHRPAEKFYARRSGFLPWHRQPLPDLSGLDHLGPQTAASF